MRETLLYMGIFYSIYGILGLFGIQIISEEYRGKKWTKSYIRCRGAAWLGMGVPWIVFYLIDRDIHIKTGIGVIILIAISLPSLIFTFVYDAKYRAMLKKEEQEQQE